MLILRRKLRFLTKFTQSSNVLCQMFADVAHTESGTYSEYWPNVAVSDSFTFVALFVLYLFMSGRHSVGE